jgi:hypothetical protein
MNLQRIYTDIQSGTSLHPHDGCFDALQLRHRAKYATTKAFQAILHTENAGKGVDRLPLMDEAKELAYIAILTQLATARHASQCDACLDATMAIAR